MVVGKPDASTRALQQLGEFNVTLETLLGIDLPIIQAPMAGVQGSALSVAVCNAGGLGSLPGALLDPAALRQELAAIRAQTTKPFNVNFFCHTRPEPNSAREAAWFAALSPYYQELGIAPTANAAGGGREPFSANAADVLEEFPPAVVSFHFGLPSPELLARVRSWGSKVLCSATTVAEALWLEERGVDAIVAQGFEAGGHRGMFLTEDLTTQVGTLSLVPQMVAAVRTPVIAAGGIADARGVAAALALGAVGVQVGTAYLLCPEASTTRGASRCAQKRRRSAHSAHQRVHGPASAIDCESLHPGSWANQPSRSALPVGRVSPPAFADLCRRPGKRRFLASVVRPECQRLQRDSRRAAHAGTSCRKLLRIQPCVGHIEQPELRPGGVGSRRYPIKIASRLSNQC